MVELWREWEGQCIDGSHTLKQCLFGNGECAVFFSETTTNESQQRTATKIILGHAASTERQLELWKAGAALSHAHLIRMLAMGKSQRGGTPFVFLVTEYADENLSQVIPDRALSEKETQELLEPALDALGYIHSQGFAHGHLKPSNFMAVDRCLKISSDGLCVFHGCDYAGRDSYSPPESNRHSAAGDVWSLGVTLVEALTQHTPDSDIQGQPLLPPALPEPFREIARHCLQMDPQARWTVSDISASLRRLTQTAPEQSAERSPILSPRRLYPWAFVALLLVLAILILPKLSHRQADSPTAPRDVVVSHPVPKPSPSVASPPNEMKEPPPADGPGVTGVIRRVLPEIPAKARHTIQGKVRIGVQVRVDPSGRVTDAKLDVPVPSRYFAQLVLKAAGQWRFTPIQTPDHNVTREMTLRFEISRTDTKVAIASGTH
jgi:TonB family protein